MAKKKQEPIIEKVKMEDLKGNMCRWPIGDPRKKETFHFCGEKQDDSCSYCPDHSEMSRRSYNPPGSSNQTTKKAA